MQDESKGSGLQGETEGALLWQRMVACWAGGQSWLLKYVGAEELGVGGGALQNRSSS